MENKAFYNVLKLLLVFNCFMYSASLFWRVNRGNCTEGEFSCDGKCIEKHRQCNSQPDCKDGQDEKFCDCILLDNVPCNNGEDCTSEESICTGEFKNCKDYKVDCREWTTESANPVESSTEFMNIFKNTVSVSEECNANGDVLCNNRTLCVSPEKACNGTIKNCEIDCSMLTTESIEKSTKYTSTTDIPDQDSTTDKTITFPTTDRTTLLSTAETTTIDVETTPKIQDLVHLDSIIVSSTTEKYLKNETREIDTKPLDRVENETSKVNVTENEKSKSDVPHDHDMKNHTKEDDSKKETTEVELPTIAANETLKDNATIPYDTANAASQTSPTESTFKPLNLFLPLGVVGVIVLCFVIAGSLILRRRRKCASYQCGHC